MSNVPCATCPWRRDADAAAIPQFCIVKARNLRNTVGEDDAFRTIMACHGSLPDEETACIGYIATQGWSNLSVRMMAINGRLDMAAIADATATIDLYESFDEMLAQLEATTVAADEPTTA